MLHEYSDNIERLLPVLEQNHEHNMQKMGGGVANFLLFNYTILGRVNLGDYIQTIAVHNALNELYENYNVDFFNRDTLSYFSINDSKLSNNPICIMQGYFANKNLWLPNKSILSIFVGTHFNGSTIDYLRHFLSYRPAYFSNKKIGCRDLWTLEHCKKLGLDAYLSRCLTLTLPKRNTQSHSKVFLTEIPDAWLQYIPSDIISNSESISQRTVSLNSWDTADYYKAAEELLQKYKNEASMVITTALHCAAPCVAMGIPVVLIAAKPKENMSRFTALNNIIPIYTAQDLYEGKIDFNPKEPNIEDLKKMMLENLKFSILESLQILTKSDSKLLSEIRKEIFIYDKL